MRYPAAVWRPGPLSKQNGGVNSCRGVVCHSMVGTFAAAMGELDKPTRRASWHFSVCQDGTVYQHYETEIQAWHAGSRYNNSTIGIEHEGGFNPENEPLTDAQRDASVTLVRWLGKECPFPLERKVGLWEHNEVSGEPTACPSHRIPWEYYTEEQEDDVAAIEIVWNPDFGRLYALGGGPPVWITDPKAAKDLQAVYGQPQKALSWAALQGLGAK